MEQQKMDLIEIERKKLAIFLDARKQEEKEWNDQQAKETEKEKETSEQEKADKFMEQRRKETLEEKEATNTTRQLARNLQDEVSNKNIASLLSNYQGIIEENYIIFILYYIFLN